MALNTLRGALAQWPARDDSSNTVGGFCRLNAIHLLHNTLAQCPGDASPQALANGAWKAATVLAGAVVEALLLWAIEQRPESYSRPQGD
jgi:hypothetical protein